MTECSTHAQDDNACSAVVARSSKKADTPPLDRCFCSRCLGPKWVIVHVAVATVVVAPVLCS